MEHADPSQFASVSKPPFGQWLIEQENREGAIGELAKHAKADRSFPKSGTVKDVWKRLNTMQVEGDLYDAMEEAELDYLAL
ncbi:YozE family protein [Sphingobium yanoikuyae]|uniref:YozE family protein n=1 Tax=Sphingobium yanoikuyae TaxID=13690 RepID=UPI00241D94FE|nr:YozE family protein [Sphingobium yanoikuyae]